ncbi:MAG: hypothetical protein IPG50_33060 [Myxococcales bacterium]|nr:hypothetical protein [Myxococcales bacterium]
MSSKALRQVWGWMDVYELDALAFADLVAGVGGCTREGVLAVVSGRRPAFCVARAIETVTRVDAHDWFVEEPQRRASANRPTESVAPPPSGRNLAAVA